MEVSKCCGCISIFVGTRILGAMGWVRFFGMAYTGAWLKATLAGVPAAAFLWLALRDVAPARLAFFATYAFYQMFYTVNAAIDAYYGPSHDEVRAVRAECVHLETDIGYS